MSKLSSLARNIGLIRKKASSEPDYVTIGRYSYGIIAENIWQPSEDAPLVIGSYCSIADGVQFYCKSGHLHDRATTFPIHRNVLNLPAPEWSLGNRRGIHIGHDVWIGRDAAIMPGVTIGDGAVIGAHAVITKDVPPYAIAAGNPAKIVKYRFDDCIISKLKEIRWWDWDDAKIKAEADALTGPIDAFVDRHCSNRDQTRDQRAEAAIQKLSIC